MTFTGCVIIVGCLATQLRKMRTYFATDFCKQESHIWTILLTTF